MTIQTTDAAIAATLAYVAKLETGYYEGDWHGDAPAHLVAEAQRLGALHAANLTRR